MTSAAMKREPRKRWLDYISAYHYVYVRTTKRGCRIFKNRTERGKNLLTRIWVRRYPYLFTKEARREFTRKAVHP